MTWFRIGVLMWCRRRWWRERPTGRSGQAPRDHFADALNCADTEPLPHVHGTVAVPRTSWPAWATFDTLPKRATTADLGLAWSFVTIVLASRPTALHRVPQPRTSPPAGI